jgi:hypothetical protein
MSCSPFDLRDYYFKELDGNARRVVEVHVKTCVQCREELDRLYATEAALMMLPDEEIPQRIGFVSDPVFEPSALARWWAAFWGSAARLGFASAAMLSIALMVFAFARPIPRPTPQAPATDRAALEAEFSQRLQTAVKQAVADSEARQAGQMQQLLDAAEKRDTFERQALMVRVQEYLEVEKKRMNRTILATNDYGEPR